MMPQNYRPGLDVVRLAALLPVLCYHYCIEAARLGFAVPTALIGRSMEMCIRDRFEICHCAPLLMYGPPGAFRPALNIIPESQGFV